MTSPLTDRELDLLGGLSLTPQNTFTPISETGRLSTASSTYATVVSWAVAIGTLGILKEVSMTTDLVGDTEYQLSIAGVVKWTNRLFQSSLGIPFPDTPLQAGIIVLLEARSPDGATAVVVDGSISGEERS